MLSWLDGTDAGESTHAELEDHLDLLLSVGEPLASAAVTQARTERAIAGIQ